MLDSEATNLTLSAPGNKNHLTVPFKNKKYKNSPVLDIWVQPPMESHSQM